MGAKSCESRICVSALRSPHSSIRFFHKLCARAQSLATTNPAHRPFHGPIETQIARHPAPAGREGAGSSGQSPGRFRRAGCLVEERSRVDARGIPQRGGGATGNRPDRVSRRVRRVALREADADFGCTNIRLGKLCLETTTVSIGRSNRWEEQGVEFCPRWGMAHWRRRLRSPRARRIRVGRPLGDFGRLRACEAIDSR
jgi:hypothetical protein